MHHSSKQPQDLIFALEDGKKPESIYTTIIRTVPKVRKNCKQEPTEGKQS